MRLAPTIFSRTHGRIRSGPGGLGRNGARGFSGSRCRTRPERVDDLEHVVGELPAHREALVIRAFRGFSSVRLRSSASDGSRRQEGPKRVGGLNKGAQDEVGDDLAGGAVVQIGFERIRGIRPRADVPLRAAAAGTVLHVAAIATISAAASPIVPTQEAVRRPGGRRTASDVAAAVR
jgi:hypothetical protein